MRVLQVSLPPNFGGGVPLYTFNLCKELASSGNELFWIFSGNWGWGRIRLSTWKSQDIHYARMMNTPLFFSNSGYPLRDIKNFKVERLFLDYLDEIKPDIVHIQNMMGFPSSIIEIASDNGYPVINSLHNYWYICQRTDLFMHHKVCSGPESMKCAYCIGTNVKNKRRAIFKKVLTEKVVSYLKRRMTNAPLIEKYFYERPDNNLHFLLKPDIPAETIYAYSLRNDYHRYLLTERVIINIAVSSLVKEKFLEFKVPEEKTIVLHIGTKAAGSIKWMPKAISNNLVVFGYIGSLQYIKGVHILIEAFSRLDQDKCKLVIYGYGHKTYLTELKDMAAGKNIEFKGRYNHEQLSDILGEFDLTIVPPIWYDNAPQVVFESLASKTPVIGAKIGGITDFVRDNENGLLFEAGNVEELKDKMQMILNNPDLVERLREGIQPMKSISDHVKEIETIYKTISSASRPDPLRFEGINLTW